MPLTVTGWMPLSRFYPLSFTMDSHRTMDIITEICTTESVLSSDRAECLRIRYLLCDLILKKEKKNL